MINGRCKKHGGRTPAGAASPHYIDGRSIMRHPHLPTEFLLEYMKHKDDPDPLNLSAEIALIDTRINGLLDKINAEASGSTFQKLRAAYKMFTTAQRKRDAPGMAEAIAEMGDLIEGGYRDFLVWEEAMRLIENRRRVVETEAKRRLAAEQVITAERAAWLIGAIISVVKDEVRDVGILGRILYGIDRLFKVHARQLEIEGEVVVETDDDPGRAIITAGAG